MQFAANKREQAVSSSTKFEYNNKTGLLPFTAQSCCSSAGAGIPSPLMQFAVY